jgi:membrane protein
VAGLGAVKDRVTAAVRRQRERRPWFDHLARTYSRYKSTNGDHLAAAITYFSFLALFPLVLLGVSVAGFVLATNLGLQQELQALIRDNVPGSLGGQLSESVASVVSNRGRIGLVGLGGVAVAGLGWIGNLRTALQVVWNCETVEENPLRARVEDLLVLVGLGIGILVSITLTAGGTSAADQLVRWVGLDRVPGMGVLTAVVGIVLALAADTLIFAWLFVRLPRRPVHVRTVLRGAVAAAVGYELLKIVGTVYLTRVTNNPTYGTFAGVIGLLIWIDLVSRFLLLAAAWTATGQHAAGKCDDEPVPTEDGTAAPPSPPPPDGPDPARRNGVPSPAAVAGVLVGAGAALGATAATAAHRYLRRHR